MSVHPDISNAWVRSAPCRISRARGLLQIFQRRSLLPRTLKFFSALGDLDAVRTALDEDGNNDGNNPATINEAFIVACIERLVAAGDYQEEVGIIP